MTLPGAVIRGAAHQVVHDVGLQAILQVVEVRGHVVRRQPRANRAAARKDRPRPRRRRQVVQRQRVQRAAGPAKHRAAAA